MFLLCKGRVISERYCLQRGLEAESVLWWQRNHSIRKPRYSLGHKQRFKAGRFPAIRIVCARARCPSDRNSSGESDRPWSWRGSSGHFCLHGLQVQTISTSLDIVQYMIADLPYLWFP